jgi:hypothetical protein
MTATPGAGKRGQRRAEAAATSTREMLGINYRWPVDGDLGPAEPPPKSP